MTVLQFAIKHLNEAKALLAKATLEEKLIRIYGTTQVQNMFPQGINHQLVDRLYLEMMIQDLNDIPEDYFFGIHQTIHPWDFLHILAATASPKVVAAYEGTPSTTQYDSSIDLAVHVFCNSKIIPFTTLLGAQAREEDPEGLKWLASVAKQLLADPTEENIQEFVNQHKNAEEPTEGKARWLFSAIFARWDMSDLVKKYKVKDASAFLHLCGINPGVLDFLEFSQF